MNAIGEWGVGAGLQKHLWEATNGYYWGVGRGYRGASGRRHMGTMGGGLSLIIELLLLCFSYPQHKQSRVK